MQLLNSYSKKIECSIYYQSACYLLKTVAEVS